MGGIWGTAFSIIFMCSVSIVTATQHVHIGGVLSNQDNQKFFQDAVESLNRREDIIREGLVFNASSIIMDANPIRSALAICKEVIPKKVHVVIASHPPVNANSPISVSYTCGYYGMPLIGIFARDSAFTDKVSLGSCIIAPD